MTEGFIAYFDILGFSERIRRGDDFIEKLDLYEDILQQAISNNYSFDLFEEPIIQFPITQEIVIKSVNVQAFSDSVIISTDSEPDSFFRLCRAVSEIQYRLALELDSPICGAISYGEYSQQRTDIISMITGRPLLKAIEFEEKQDWVGVMIAPSVLESEMSKNLDTRQLLHGSTARAKTKIANLHHHFIYHMWDQIPLTTGQFKSLVVVPIDPKTQKLHALQDSLIKYNEKLHGLLLKAPDPHAQRKYTKSIRFIEKVTHDTQMTIANNPEFREMNIWCRF